MATSTQKDAVLNLSLDGVEVNCQVYDASITPSAPGDSTPIPVACGETVSEPGDPQNGTIQASAFKDTSASGLTRLLIVAAMSGAEVDYTYVENPGVSDQELSFSGKATVPAFQVPFTPDKYGKHDFTLNLTTSVLADALA